MSESSLRWSVILCAVVVYAAGCEATESQEPPPDTAVDVVDVTDDGGGHVNALEALYTLPVQLSRPEDGAPVTPTERVAFTTALDGLLLEMGYFDYVLRSSHGVDASTGLPEYMLWWSDVDAVRDGDTVRFEHRDLPEHGGHNIAGAHARILGAAILSYFRTGDPTAARTAALYCRGIGALMLGMVHDADDPLPHLMARNVITFDHAYQTHDGRKKEVSYSKWYHAYSRWNCERFLYADNPTWGPVWVTNVRSKDDVGEVLRVAGFMEMASLHAGDADMRDACGASLELLRGFTADIADHGYYIRTKDTEGAPFIFSLKEKPEGMKVSTDLDNFVTFDPFFPAAECNQKRACDWIGHHDGTRNDCGDGGTNMFERVSLENNYPNVNFYRAYHMANLLQSYLHDDAAAAQLLLEGLVRRFEADMSYDITHVPVSGDRWHSDLAVALVRAAALGYPLTNREVRLVHLYYGRAIDRLSGWAYWDLWADGIPDGVYDYKPPNRDVGEDGEQDHWIKVPDLAALVEYCASPYRNPAGVPPVDCDILGRRDQASGGAEE